MIFEGDQKFIDSKESKRPLDSSKEDFKVHGRVLEFSFLAPQAVPLLVRRPTVLKGRGAELQQGLCVTLNSGLCSLLGVAPR